MKGLPWVIDADTHPLDIHVMPLEDLRPHTATRECWCHPVEEERELTCPDGVDRGMEVFVHVALDARDQYEPDGGPLPLH